MTTTVLGALLVLASVSAAYLFVRTNAISGQADKLGGELRASQVRSD
jgi:hypothetical protein